jgi:hypothetical protein
MKVPALTTPALNLIRRLPLPYAMLPKVLKAERAVPTQAGGGVPTSAQDTPVPTEKHESGDTLNP